MQSNYQKASQNIKKLDPGGMKIFTSKKYVCICNIKFGEGLIFSPNFLHGNESIPKIVQDFQ